MRVLIRKHACVYKALAIVYKNKSTIMYTIKLIKFSWIMEVRMDEMRKLFESHLD